MVSVSSRTWPHLVSVLSRSRALRTRHFISRPVKTTTVEITLIIGILSVSLRSFFLLDAWIQIQAITCLIGKCSEGDQSIFSTNYLSHNIFHNLVTDIDLFKKSYIICTLFWNSTFKNNINVCTVHERQKKIQFWLTLINCLKFCDYYTEVLNKDVNV